MYRNCTTEKSAAQQQLFQQCLLERMKHQPYEEITVTALCEVSGLSRRIFYRLFDSKDDVFCALIDQTLRQFDAQRFSSETVYGGLCAMFSYWRSQEALLEAVARNLKVSLLTTRCLQHVLYEDRVTRRYLAAPEQPGNVETVVYFVSGIMGLLIYWHHSGYTRTVEEMARIAEQLLTNPPLSHR